MRMRTGRGMKEGDKLESVPSTRPSVSYLRLLPEVQPDLSYDSPRTLRHSLHTSRKLLTAKCSKCYNDIDSGTEYWSWAGIVAGAFWWHYTHGRC